MGDKQPKNINDPRVKWLRFAHPDDPDQVIQLAVRDTGVDTPDGVRIMELKVDTEIEVSGPITLGAVQIQDHTTTAKAHVEQLTGALNQAETGLYMKAKSFLSSADGSALVEPRAEDGHGSSAITPSFVQYINAPIGYNSAQGQWYMQLRDPTGAAISDANPLPIKQVITKSIEELYSDTIAASGNDTSSVLDMQNLKGLVVTVSASFHASATAGITVKAYSSIDGVAFDDEPYAEDFEPTFVAGQTRQVSFPLDSMARYMRFAIVNLDTGQSVDVDLNVTKVV